MRNGGERYSDIRHRFVLNSTCHIVKNKRQGHATLPFLKIDMRSGAPHQGPQEGTGGQLSSL